MSHQSAIGTGIDRTSLLPNLPERDLSPHDTEGRVMALGKDIDNLFSYLKREREELLSSYDDLSRRLNEMLTSAEWLEVSPAQITANQNDYEFEDAAIVYRLSTDASRTITGFLEPISEKMMVIVNVGSSDLILADQNASSAAVNRIITTTGADVTLGADASAILWYDGVTERWRQMN